MIIPKEDAARSDFYNHVLDECFKSRDRRTEQYRYLNHFFMNGTAPGGGKTPYNKIFPTIDTLTAFLFAADSTRFSVHLGPEVPAQEWEKVPAASKAINSEWENSNGDEVFSLALTQAMVFNSMFMKIIVKGGHITPYTIEPHLFGVYREDVNYLDRQEAMAHKFYITRSELEAQLVAHPNKASILASISSGEQKQEVTMPAGLQRILMQNQYGSPPIPIGGTASGSLDLNFDTVIDYSPESNPDLIEMTEMWVWDDSTADYQVVTLAHPGVIIYDRPNFFVPKEHPFVHICPNPMNGYFWGTSEVNRLIGLQAFRNERMEQVRDLLAKQVNPPHSLEGWTGALDEVDFALNRAGGVLTSSDPMTKIQQYPRTVPTDVFTEIRFIDEMFSEASGLQNILMGRGESGVRSGRQTTELARLGSSRIKKRGLVIENNLESLATKYFKAMRKYDPDKYLMIDGKTPFVMEQVTSDALVKVDAHSNSPLFVEDLHAQASELLQMHAISRARYIEMTKPPMKDVILQELKGIEQREAEAQKAKAEQENAALSAKQSNKTPAK